MKKIILLTGKPRVGKTTALKKIINMVGKDKCTGFYTEEVRDETDRIGFDCSTLEGKRARIADVNFNSDVSLGRYGINIGNFEKVGIESIEGELESKPIIIIDEIGPMQFLSEKFKKTLNEVFSSRKIVIGTIVLRSHLEIDEIKKRDDIKIYELTEENREKVIDDIILTLGLNSDEL